MKVIRTLKPSNVDTFDMLVEIIVSKSPLQKKALAHFLASRDEHFRERADWFTKGLASLCVSKNIDLEYIVEAYLQLCKDMLCEQIHFQKTGTYRRSQAAQAYADVYASREKMQSYMYGLALSLFLWPNHYAMLDFFLTSCQVTDTVRKYLEIGMNFRM